MQLSSGICATDEVSIIWALNFAYLATNWSTRQGVEFVFQ